MKDVVYGCSSPTGGCVELQIGECYSNPQGTYLACEFAFPFGLFEVLTDDRKFVADCQMSIVETWSLWEDGAIEEDLGGKFVFSGDMRSRVVRDHYHQILNFEVTNFTCADQSYCLPFGPVKLRQ